MEDNIKKNYNRLNDSFRKNDYTILVIEDNEGLNRLIGKKLKREGYKVKTAFTAEEGYSGFTGKKNEILLLDYKLPDATGKEIIKTLNKDHDELNFMVMTGQGDERIAVDIMKLGALDYAIKDDRFLEVLPQKIERVCKYVHQQNKLKLFQKAQDVIYKIARAMFETGTINDFYDRIKKYLNEIFDTSNLSIVLLDEKKDTFTFSYCQGPHTKPKIVSTYKTLIKHVVETREPFLATKDNFIDLKMKSKILETDKDLKAWLGIPLRKKDNVIGVIILQDYDDEVNFHDLDLQLLEFVSTQISICIEKKKAQQLLEIVKQRLETATSILRHDITNDLTVIKSALNIYRKNADKTMLDEIDIRLNKCFELIQKQKKQELFLKEHISLKDYDLRKLLTELDKKNDQVNIKIEGNSHVFADEAIDSVFNNLISNAIQHGNAKNIFVKIVEKDEKTIIRFSDDGSGIPARFSDKIFNKGFKFGPNAHTGIGLYNVKRTIEEYGGTFKFVDENTEGATFEISLVKVIREGKTN